MRNRLDWRKRDYCQTARARLSHSWERATSTRSHITDDSESSAEPLNGESDGYESISDDSCGDEGHFNGQHVPNDLAEKEEPPSHELRILALNPDGTLSTDETLDLA